MDKLYLINCVINSWFSLLGQNLMPLPDLKTKDNYYNFTRWLVSRLKRIVIPADEEEDFNNRRRN